MDPLTASLIAAGVSAATPYVIDGGRYLWNEFVDTGLSDEQRKNFDLGAINQEQLKLEGLQDTAMSDAIRSMEQSSGRSVGAQIAQGMGTGLTGMSPISMLQSQQGELMASKSIGQAKMEQASVAASRFSDKSGAANSNIMGIKSEGHGSSKTNEMLMLYANNEQDPAIAQMYRNAMV